jgi:glycosyl hydrolase family 28/pectate lyase-like protein
MSRRSLESPTTQYSLVSVFLLRDISLVGSVQLVHDGKMISRPLGILFGCALAAVVAQLGMAQRVFNVRDYGASGRKNDDARPALQKAIDACGRSGGGRVYIPPGEYTAGQLHLRSGVRLYLEAGATIYATLDSRQYDDTKKAALIYGEDLHDIALEGAGTLDGQASYEWHLNSIVDYYILPNQRQMEATGKPLLRSFPTGFPKETVYPRMVLLLRCIDVRIAGLKFLRSRSWTINPYACQRLVIDGVYIYSSQKEGVWADGIDPDGCRDVYISNSTIETGDDAIVFYSTGAWGPVLPTENVTVTNSRLSSSSSAIKFCDGNSRAVRHVVISNVVIVNSNRGLAFMVFDGGIVEDVVIANVTIDTRRFDWFWWGDGDPIHFNIKRRSEVDGQTYDHEPAAGIIRNVTISNVIAHGQGTSALQGHHDSWLQGIRFDHVRLFVSHSADAPYESTTAAMTLKYARDVELNDVEIAWEEPHASTWKSGLLIDEVEDLSLNGARIDAAPDSTQPALRLNNVNGALITQSRIASVHITGQKSRSVRLRGTEASVTEDPGVAPAITN